LRPEHQKIADQAVHAFAERIRELRGTKGWSQERLAEEADLHRTYVGGIERGLRNVSLWNIAKLAHAFGVPIVPVSFNEFYRHCSRRPFPTPDPIAREHSR
jgi:transcriptional regulator with XRE-family HTH domain